MHDFPALFLGLTTWFRPCLPLTPAFCHDCGNISAFCLCGFKLCHLYLFSTFVCGCSVFTTFDFLFLPCVFTHLPFCVVFACLPVFAFPTLEKRTRELDCGSVWTNNFKERKRTPFLAGRIKELEHFPSTDQEELSELTRISLTEFNPLQYHYYLTPSTCLPSTPVPAGHSLSLPPLYRQEEVPSELLSFPAVVLAIKVITNFSSAFRVLLLGPESSPHNYTP